jgi:hypothetical protein
MAQMVVMVTSLSQEAVAVTGTTAAAAGIEGNMPAVGQEAMEVKTPCCCSGAVVHTVLILAKLFYCSYLLVGAHV